MEKEVFEKLKGIIVEQLGCEESTVTMEANFVDDLAADSLDLVELVMEIEEQFDIKVEDEVVEKVNSVSDIVKYICENK